MSFYMRQYMHNNSLSISIIIPLYNEDASINKLFERLLVCLPHFITSIEILLINDGSTDATLQKIKELAGQNPCIKYISFSRNFGHQVAVSAGLDHCRGQAVVIMDGDLQDPPELIPKLYNKYKEGYDVVYAKRTRRNGESWFKQTTASLFYRILQRFTSFNFPLDAGDFRLIDRKVVEMLRQMPEQNKFLRGQIAWMGFRQTYVEFERDARRHGQTGYPFKKMLDFALDGITSLSHRPLRLVTQAGFMVSFLSFLILLYALGSHFILERTITGWTSLIITVAFLGGVQLLSIGIIGEYISRINKNILNRPLYIVEESNC
jgi:polyisoprenyl-phosphate glycosyltransferase